MTTVVAPSSKRVIGSSAAICPISANSLATALNSTGDRGETIAALRHPFDWLVTGHCQVFVRKAA